MKNHDDTKPPKPASDDKHGEKPAPKHGPNESGPKERELAIEMTLAVLNVAEFAKSDPMAIADAAEDIYRRMLVLIGPAGPQQLPPLRPRGDDGDGDGARGEDSAA